MIALIPSDSRNRVSLPLPGTAIPQVSSRGTDCPVHPAEDFEYHTKPTVLSNIR